ncbi:SusC/RagA family TonB-linked outer membrane protein [Galbibacter sp. PAP.153]|uniref:SusC/RagA family TonB-linked outer membrane protein n=1 Tax=Galbibacter sp. PAP.153 TaxID=3104623 RepID=UPI00300B48FF
MAKLKIIQQKLYLNKKIQKTAARCILIFLFAIMSIPATAQNTKTISGTVTSASDNIPLIGATVTEKGTQNGVATDFDGKYTISCSDENATIVISYIGFLPKEINIHGRSSINVQLTEDATNLKEVVVTALGIKRESRAVGYAISEVESDNLNAGGENNAMKALTGKVAGVDISPTIAGPAGSTRVVIRGNSQLTGNNTPLYVIDGVPMDNTQLGQADKWGGYDYGDGLSAISPEDIETISVLKGASASALYGSRASNGVILITTKSGKKKTGLGIEFSSRFNFVKLASNFDDYQREYGQGRNGEAPITLDDGQTTTQAAWGAKLDPSLSTYIYNGELKPYQNVPDNILSFFRTGGTTTNSVSFSSGNGFRASVSDMNYNDIVPNSDMRRTTFMLNGKSDFGEKLTVQGRVNYTIEDVKNRPALSDHPNNVGNAIIGIAPNFNQKWLSENYKDEEGRYVDWNGGNIYRINPYWTINEMSNNSEKKRVMGYLQLNYQILPFLSMRLNGGTDFYTFKSDDFTPRHSPTQLDGSFVHRQVSVVENNFEAMLRFDKKFNKLSVSSLIAGNIRYNESETYVNSGVNEVLSGLKSILNYRTYTLSNDLYRKQVNSVYGAVNLGYDDFAYLDFTWRNDVSSTLSSNNRSYWYPSLSGSLVFSSLFNMDKGFLSFGKLRASWAQVGGDTDPYKLGLNYGLYDFTFNDYSLGEIKSTVVPNKNLKPTRTNSYEVGTDLRFFKNRIKLDVSYYNQETVDQILELTTSTTTGYNSASINSGKIVNKGFEVALSVTPVETRDFHWDATLTYANNNNEVVALHPDIKTYTLAEARWLDTYIYAMEGENYGVIVGKPFKRNEDGAVIFENGMPTYESENEILGNGVPDFTAGLNQLFRYKDFSLRVLFDMKWGLDIFSMSHMLSNQMGTTKETLEGRAGWYASEAARIAAGETTEDWVPTGGYIGQGVKNIGTEEAPEYVPNDVYVDPQDYWTNVASNSPEPFIDDASYIKLRELNLSYNIPSRILDKTPLTGVSLSLYGRNLATLYSKVKNIDPESGYNSSNGQGFEYGSLPSRRTIGFGLNVKF